MSPATVTRPAQPDRPSTMRHTPQVGPLARLGRYTATHFRQVLLAWLLVAVMLGLFAPEWRRRCRGPAGKRAAPSPRGAQADRTRLRRPRQLWAHDRRPLIHADRRQPRLQSGDRPRAAHAARRPGRSGRSWRPPQISRSQKTGTPRSCRPAPRAPQSHGRRRRQPQGQVAQALRRRGTGQPDRRRRTYGSRTSSDGEPLGDALRARSFPGRSRSPSCCSRSARSSPPGCR